jgi:hypothetical protein
MIGKFQQKYQFWDGFGKGFGRVWEGLEGIKIRWKKDVKIRGRGAQVPIAALGRNLYRGRLRGVLGNISKNGRGDSRFRLDLGIQNGSQNHEKSDSKNDAFFNIFFFAFVLRFYCFLEVGP